MPVNKNTKDFEPYHKSEPGDPIRAGDWNNMQIEIRKALNVHNHDGDLDDGGQLDAGAIDPGSELTVKGLTITDKLKAKKDLSVEGNAGIKGNLKVTGSYHNGEVLGGYLQPKTYELLSKEHSKWDEIWTSDKIAIKKDSIIQLSIMGYWTLKYTGSNAWLRAMINNDPVNPGPDSEDRWGTAYNDGTGHIDPIIYNAVREVKKGDITLGVAVVSAPKKPDEELSVQGLRMNYLIIPK